ncbi:bacillithiol biosynthesis deacetylase BshB2 [Bacillus altitudinis MN12]|jgi:N-acetylglucosamine malate deacetylase 2|uniref:Bacillithiol biosynthesis deacetylase BshB2 n=2 Tax=Bacillus TaxID=1386 RepID=A0ABV1S9J7_BACAB|nr:MULTISPECIES: bacillithiol biosynthesis deacetylase BshB2 [Bacillus]ANT56924.1 deacetylase [Bacillus pumilus]EMI11964.1 bacillithiol biosynthesis deacetylase 2 [Bacillus stratosphericus LAMA 585]KMK99863.1 deacetylase [Bacillus stratosphericus]MBR3207652.1 bacillithiol biosynthesis deacetylase BshB2 [Bacillus sp. (in: firmicutes)]MBW3702188.1 bacillithiol biosynthesis deacetylase BshB2 [Bacillus aerophilus]MDH8710651.1 bacillithiol biosynthesis deacetylase BshB2 [Micromonospora sp. 1209]
MNEHVLVMLPHPDDESFGVAGLIAQSRKRGIPVTYACGTLGEMGRNMGSPTYANRETLPELRKQELINACKEMDVTDLRMLGLRDKTLEFEDDEYLADVMERIIDEVKPTLIVTFYPGHGVHPDHDATGEAVIRALYRKKKEDRPVTYCMAITKNREEVLGNADIVIDITDVADIKLNALRAHRTQTEGMLRELEQKLKNKEPVVQKWFDEEIFWTYQWND